MNSMLSEALNRTVLLVRDEMAAEADDATIISALTSTSVVLVADVHNISSHAAQCAFVTAALLMARSGHRVYLAAPDVPLQGAQPPLRGNRLIAALLGIAAELLPGIGFSFYPPCEQADLAVVFGNSRLHFRARRTIALNATAWSASLDVTVGGRRWIESTWPCGSLAAGAIASVEAFKFAMHRLRKWSKDNARFDNLFAFTDRVSVNLAAASTPRIARLGCFDLVSGGAITNSTLYMLARLPGVEGLGSVMDPEVGDLSNMNRYPLMLQSAVNEPKVSILKSLMPASLRLRAIRSRFERTQKSDRAALAPHVLVGVDDIPTRWDVQAHEPQWLGIGATTHWDAMASFHRKGLACARCLHPRDDSTTAPIPTVAFVSFFAGLMLGCSLLRDLSGERVQAREQCSYFSPLRPERLWRSPVATRVHCPTCSSEAGASAA